uniref:AAA+ ATPase domain-containing protein n=1 Tax=viral metagenome TaxID=1070528 RepID=A0A6C0DVX2_9ZZZZ
MAVDISFWCERVRKCFSMFLKDPQTLQHLLLFGPPGSGKTTSAGWLVEQIWGNRKSLMCISMNAADERSLESIRQKVFPFLRVDWRVEGETSPRFLILDECETLTEAAQLSLQTILNYDSKDICVVLICNSQSRIHPKLRQRLLKIRYDPPNRNNQVTDIFTAITRGDLRQTTRKSDIEYRIWKYIHCHPSQIISIIQDDNVDFQAIVSEILLLSDIFSIIDNELVNKINLMYPLIIDSTILHDETEKQILGLIQLFKRKFEMKFVSN